MAVVKYLDNSIECAKALKGDDYVHLLDADGNMIAAFDGISDFSGFSITGGSWTTPTADHDCYLAVMKDDGTIGKGGHKCSDVLPKSGGTMTGALTTIKVNVASSDNFPCVDFYNSDGVKVGFIQYSANTRRFSFVQTHTDQDGKSPQYRTVWQLPAAIGGLTDDKYLNILTSQGGSVFGNLAVDGASLLIKNGIPQLAMANADGSEWYGVLQAGLNGSGSNYWARLGVRGKGTSFYEYYSTPSAANNLTEHKYYQILTNKDPVTLKQGGTGAKTADEARANLGLGAVNICDRVIKNAGVDGVSVEVPVSENLHNFSRIAFAFQDGTSSPVYPRIPGFTRHSVHNGSKSAEFEESADGNSIKCTQQTADAIVIGIFGWR